MAWEDLDEHLAECFGSPGVLDMHHLPSLGLRTWAQRAAPTQAPCRGCGATLPASTTKPRAWCSPACRVAHRPPAARPAPPVRTCRGCDAALPPPKRSRPPVWCSSACRARARYRAGETPWVPRRQRAAELADFRQRVQGRAA